jgi:hypothetical protein
MDQAQKTKKDDSLMHDFAESSPKPAFSMKLVAVLLVIALLGIGTGFGFAKMNAGERGISGEELTKDTEIKVGERYGDGDTKTFKDNAEGVIKEGGIDGEGQFTLIQSNNPDNPAALTSSTVDLSLFIDRKVKIWGQTFEAEKAGWLLDVGQLEVLE